ncbi:MAG: helix-turn-helix domain-containing protein [Planctomycetaceae bacterium]|nr:helix-turn-helix domain-containing protein [Planctomycetaceae bacterium]
MKSIAAQRAESWQQAEKELSPHLNVRDVALLFGVHRTTVINWHKNMDLEADIPPSGAKRTFRYPKQRVIQFARNNNLEIQLSALLASNLTR